ncbi:hypothetical protein J7E99_12040 [Streptomyces sp. ISL-44]|uniref:hypothetical protein n=1 Tax=Streptomyces sp. ISL-44 TaxID=2819184 RepID=UPI001BEB0D70|nr:hypothetical protein [Streptomyces sp. ISL-44]MBT2541422.1 hypothetical protein [Streptomyces sp. ISL-44]
MSHEVVPETHRQTGQTGQAAHDDARQESTVPAEGGAPKGLLQQMEELMAALNADLSQLDADLQSSSTDRAPGAPAPGEERPSYRSF